MIPRLWPRSLKGQLLLAVALALLLAQTVHAIALYRAMAGQRTAGLAHSAAYRVLRAARIEPAPQGRPEWRGEGRSFWLERSPVSPLHHSEPRYARMEGEIQQVLAEQEFETSEVVATIRDISADGVAQRRLARRANLAGHPPGPPPRKVMVAGVRVPGDPQWTIVRVFVPPGEFWLVVTLIGQTVLIYAVLVGAIALFLRRITRPLAALTGRLERFAETRDPGGQIAPEGPDDVRRLIVAHNSMEERIAALIDEKDVMLGAIGHDLKTPLAALRVRIETVEDEAERSRIAATIEDMNRSLDDILALARAGHAREPSEPAELSALAMSVVEEYEDMGEPVSLTEPERIVLPLRPTWLRRALRNLIGNALRYGKVARVSLVRNGGNATIRIDDDGPGIPEGDMARMLEPFTRGEPSRNSATGGSGLGLALARAIAEQHGGRLELRNRHLASGEICGLSAELHLPIPGAKHSI